MVNRSVTSPSRAALHPRANGLGEVPAARAVSGRDENGVSGGSGGSLRAPDDLIRIQEGLVTRLGTRIVEVGKDQPDDPVQPAGEPAGHPVGRVSDGLDYRQHPLGLGRGHHRLPPVPATRTRSFLKWLQALAAARSMLRAPLLVNFPHPRRLAERGLLAVARRGGGRRASWRHKTPTT